MKKIYFLYTIILGSFLLIVGCETINSGGSGSGLLPYIQPVSPQQDLISVSGVYELKFFVVNPTVNTFIGDLTYKFDTTCLSTKGISGNQKDTGGVQISPKSQFGITREFTYTTFDQYNRPTKPERLECLQRPLKVTVSLFDAGGDSRGSQDFFVTVSQ